MISDSINCVIEYHKDVVAFIMEMLMLNQDMINRIESVLKRNIVSQSSIAGGCCCDNYRLLFNDGSSVFCKTAPPRDGLFKAEAVGLHELNKSDFVIPEPLYVCDDFLLLEYLNPSALGDDFYTKAGTFLAKMHRIESERFGFRQDNYIGLTEQRNTVMDSWPQFYFVNRLEFQLKLLEKKGLLSSELRRLFSKLEARYAHILPESGLYKPVLLHGDLWSGNLMPANAGEPSIFDPAVYYGHNEAELAMTFLFGGFPEAFYHAYFSVNQQDSGFEYRQPIYKLYHMLNHLNLFGSSYERSVFQLIKYYIN